MTETPDAVNKNARRVLDDALAKSSVTPDTIDINALALEYPPPSGERGDYFYSVYEGRPWLWVEEPPPGAEGEDEDEPPAPVQKRLWTPLTLRAGIVAVDQQRREGVRIDVMNSDGIRRTLTISAADAFASQGGPFKIRLRDAGVGMTGAGEALAVRLVRETAPKDPIELYDRPGWRAPALFITPWGDASHTNREVELNDEVKPTGLAYQGTLEGWTAATATAWGTDVLQMKIAPLVALAAPIIDLCGADSVWIAYTSQTSKGKTTAARLQAGVWGDTRPRAGLYGPLNGTENAAEVRLAMGAGAGYAFDETNLISGDRLQTLIFKGSGGAGNDRLNRSAQLREARTWRGAFSLTGEHGLMRKIKASGVAATTGIGTRVLELDTENTRTWPREVMNQIEAVYENFGHAGPAFIRHLIDNGFNLEPVVLWQGVEAKAVILAGEGASAAVVRAARIAAVLWRAGELAQAAGLIPDDDALLSGALALPDGEDDGVGDDANDTAARVAIPYTLPDVIKEFWRRSQESDLAPVNGDDVAVKALFENLLRNRGGRVADGVGESRVAFDACRLEVFGEGKEAVYVVPKTTLSDLAGGALNATALAKVLRKRDALILRADGNRTWWTHVAGIGKLDAVIIRASEVEGAKD